MSKRSDAFDRGLRDGCNNVSLDAGGAFLPADEQNALWVAEVSTLTTTVNKKVRAERKWFG